MYNIVTLNCYFNSDTNKINSIHYFDDNSLLDADILFCRPADIITENKHLLTNTESKIPFIKSLHVKKYDIEFNRRKSEITKLLEYSKIVIFFIHPIQYLKWRDESLVDILSNYDILPIDYSFKRLVINGKTNYSNSIRINQSNTILNPFVSALKNDINCCSYFDLDIKNENDHKEVLLFNKVNCPVSIQHKVNNGYIFFVPLYRPTEINDKKVVNAFIQIADRIYNNKRISPKPDWINKNILSGEEGYTLEIEIIQKKIDELNKKKEEIENNRSEVTDYKRLLFEQGFELEDAVLKSFRLMGFKAEQRKTDDLEHDIIFESAEGKGIAEVEGKERDSIHVDKLDQLSRVVDEHFAISNEYPQGILIGNHCRLVEPDKRKEAFTEKVQITAERKKFGLLTTIELYKSIEFVLMNPEDEDFKKKCREMILNTTGKEIKLSEIIPKK